jgi:hypothetical protein
LLLRIAQEHRVLAQELPARAILISRLHIGTTNTLTDFPRSLKVSSAKTAPGLREMIGSPIAIMLILLHSGSLSSSLLQAVNHHRAVIMLMPPPQSP